MPDFVNATNSPGLSRTLTPPTIAASQSPAAIARTAWCSATSELEHAVSMASLGPGRSSRCDTRLARIEWAIAAGGVRLDRHVVPSRSRSS